jgi:hypothetical protein
LPTLARVGGIGRRAIIVIPASFSGFFLAYFGLSVLRAFVRERLEAKSALGVRLRRAQLRSQLVQFPSEVETTSADCADDLTSAGDATSCSWPTAEMQAVKTTSEQCFISWADNIADTN